MKKFIQHIFLFLLILITIAVALNIYLTHTTKKNDYYQLQYNEVIHPAVNADNIIIGTSHAVHGIQPEILNTSGHRFYNFAFDGANPEFYLKWYKNIFKPHYKKPTTIVVAVEWFLFNTDWLWRRYEQDAAYFPPAVYNRHLIEGEPYNRSLLINNRYAILKYRTSLIKEISTHDTYSYPVSKFKYGFIPYQVKKPVVTEFYPKNVRIDEHLQNQFEALIEMINKDGVKLIFIQVPSFNTDAGIYKVNPTYKYFKSLADKYNAPFIDYNTDYRSTINTSKKYFSDGGHMNEAGSIEFSKLLSAHLKKIIQ